MVLAMWSNAVAWVLCPYVSGSPNHCFEQQSAATSHRNVKDAHLQHMNADAMQMQMSDPDMHGMDMEHASVSQSCLESIVDAELPGLTPISSLIVTLIESTDSCSHCVMHSRSDASESSRSFTVNGASYQSMGSGSSTDVLTTLPWLLVQIDIRDHGPPGSNNPRYILNSTYRI